jgi:hypothetical protein
LLKEDEMQLQGLLEKVGNSRNFDCKGCGSGQLMQLIARVVEEGGQLMRLIARIVEVDNSWN